MNLNSERTAFEQQILTHLEDWTLKGIYADWLEEHNEPDLAYAYRWMMKAKKAPHYYSTQSRLFLKYPEGVEPASTAFWFWYVTISPGGFRIWEGGFRIWEGIPDYSQLSRPLFEAVATSANYQSDTIEVRTSTHAQAIDYLALGLLRLRRILEPL